ncbi:MAG: sigma-54 dependent transcriptional regulator [Microscillaceae bacterium]|nr:sigma-54 dependent transcriptional regulator [Microscillaceae bacterium]MDW8460100.1 sigma-54 dependent transcriptional regulator [Cytophagales bacterium]
MIDPEQIQAVKRRFDIIGNSPLLNQAIERAILVANTDVSVLITGESGSGKESFSKIIHNLSHRKNNKFIAINCGALPEGTINSELFGHEKGAFTGAAEMRKGYFEEANGGTIFLDEIGEMPAETQARLLRVLEYGEFIRVGSSKVLKTDVRIIAATNVNLLEAIEQKKFREDLYYRLSTMPIYVPPLRERGNDILLLFRKFATDFAEKYCTRPIELNEAAKQTLLSFRFPGNIRQLKNLVEQLSVLEYDRVITPEMLLKAMPQEQRQNALTLASPKFNSQADMNERDIFYKILLDMRKDLAELKKLVLQLLQSGSSLSPNVIQARKELFAGLPNTEQVPTFGMNNLNSTLLLTDSTTNPLPKTIDISNNIQNKNITIQDVSHEETSDSLSIEQKEKELIIKALQKHKNRRKPAAEELGVSERTLYRKIKQYDIE